MEYPGHYKTPIIELDPDSLLLTMSIDDRIRVMRLREKQRLAYFKTFRGKMENLIWHYRGRISDWIAPKGWNDE